MKLLVRVIEARNIPAMGSNGLSDLYVKLQLGRQKCRTKVLKKCLNPSWCEEFTFKVDDLREKLQISVLDEDKYFNDDFVGNFRVPISQVFEAKDKSLGTSWYTLRPKSKKSKDKDCGEILLTICFSQNNSLPDLPPIADPINPRKSTDMTSDLPSVSSPLRSSSPMRSEEEVPFKEDKSYAPTFSGRIAQIFNKNVDSVSVSSNDASDISDLPESLNAVGLEDKTEEQSSSIDFEEVIKTMEMREQGDEIPSSLPGG